jgi:foldase protein PrsA
MGVVLMTAALCTALWAAFPALAQKSAKRPSATDAGAQVVATVNGAKITLAQAMNEVLADQMARLNAVNPEMRQIDASSVGKLVLKQMNANGGKPVTISRAEIMDWMLQDKAPALAQKVRYMIQERAIAQAAKQQGITVTPAEVTKKLAESLQTARVQFRPDQKMTDAQVLAWYGVRPSYLRSAIVTQIQVDKLVRKDIETKIGHPVGPGDFAEASHLLVKVNPDPQKPNDTEKAYEAAKTKILGYAEEIKSGKKTFEQAAEQYSDDGSKLKQGKLGVFMRGQMVPEFEKAVFSLKKGEMSEPVRTPFGWHLIRLDRPGSEISVGDREQTLQNYIRSRTQSYVMELVQKAKVTNRLAPEPAGPIMLPGGGR